MKGLKKLAILGIATLTVGMFVIIYVSGLLLMFENR